ncbi:EAL domain-containing protein [Psychrobium sp. MM17-31]|uniref:bifunctional diguanylate cyclase/phosphodiesterase n=1 Tax=Psychrobium sp. MM17-31 TaxID=2917758 RepID=UPI001EF53875|nr:EAL domain-containing protein [Psychrobium sp. MM17-31]MCG7529869.1 EAL domain-containing protein [Psychrobium sp. MM17-31]
MHSLQNRIFLFFVLLLLFVQAIALSTLFAGKQNQESREITNRLNTAKTLFTEQYNSRSQYLAAFAETVAKDYGIKAVFSDDQRSLLAALNNHRKRIDADLAMAISKPGNITAQLQLKYTDDNDVRVVRGKELDQMFRYNEWLGSDSSVHLYEIGSQLYQLSLSPITVGSQTLGWVGFGFEIDETMAQNTLKLTHLETDFVYKYDNQWRLVASSNPESSLKFALDVVNGKTPEGYIGIGHIINSDGMQQFGLALYGFRDDFVSVLQDKWGQLLALTLIALLLSLAGAYAIALSITKPIKRLVKQAKVVARGHYDEKVELNDKSELGQLAEEFNAMQSAVLSREEAILHRANHNPLTELPNRLAAVQMVEALVAKDSPFTVYHLNLSRIKDVNESLGHEVGDRLIREAAKRLVEIKNCCFLGHLGADEFILIIEESEGIDIDEMVTRLLDLFEGSFDLKSMSLQIQIKLGIAKFPQHCGDGKSILQMSDTALNFARKHNQTIQVYHSGLDVNSAERLNLINDLKYAISDDQLELHYQPKLNLKTGIVTHVEALVRWQHPKLGMVPPDSFIHIAEQTGQINALTQWVFVTALKQYNTWKEQGIDINIAVNISAENLKDIGFEAFVRDSVTQYQVPNNYVTLEVTESAVVDNPEAAIALLRRFKEDGFKISIDDYGTGYSSLAQLKQLPVNELKIDKSFVQKLESDEDDQIIVRSTIELAHNMGLSVVAEGIEDEYSLHWLAKHGCELAQGYYISRPQPSEKLTPWLKEEKEYNLEISAKG